jgi:hypothetical protein
VRNTPFTPAPDYDGLRKQAVALAMLVRAQEAELQSLRDKDSEREREKHQTSLSALDSEREANRQLTEQVEQLQAQLDALQGSARYETGSDEEKISTWPFTEGWHALLAYVRERWDETYGRWQQDDERLVLIAGGWSENEALVNALMSNMMFRALFWEASIRGGRYEFKMPPAATAQAAPAPDKRFFRWIVECCELLGWPASAGENMLPEKDPCWFFAFDDGVSPHQAVSHYKTFGGGEWKCPSCAAIGRWSDSPHDEPVAFFRCGVCGHSWKMTA